MTYIRQYGIKTVNPKPLLKIIPKLFGHTDKNVRAEVSIHIYNIHVVKEKENRRMREKF